jgi:antitoxin ParD1/3/4
MVTLSPEHEQLIQSQLATGRYTNAEEVIDLALHLLVYLDQESQAWIAETRRKIAEGIIELDQGKGVDGPTVMNQFLDRFQAAQQNQHL